MSQIYYNPEIQTVLERMLLPDAQVALGKMFGYPAYYVNKKMFACVYEDAVGLKVPFALAASLIGQEGITPFVPMGRRQMKEWIQISHPNPEDFLNDLDLFHQSILFVSSPR
mgnify:CR=1 FL=1